MSEESFVLSEEANRVITHMANLFSTTPAKRAEIEREAYALVRSAVGEERKRWQSSLGHSSPEDVWRYVNQKRELEAIKTEGRLARLAREKEQLLESNSTYYLTQIELWKKNVREKDTHITKLEDTIVRREERITHLGKRVSSLSVAVERSHDANDTLKAEVGRLHALLERADALLPPENPVQQEVSAVLQSCSDVTEGLRAEVDALEVERRRQVGVICRLHGELECSSHEREQSLRRDLDAARKAIEEAAWLVEIVADCADNIGLHPDTPAGTRARAWLTAHGPKGVGRG